MVKFDKLAVATMSQRFVATPPATRWITNRQRSTIKAAWLTRRLE